MDNQISESVWDFEVSDFDFVPPGQYVAVFKNCTKTHHEQWGDGVMFSFEIVVGPHKGQTVTRIGKPKASSQNATGKLIAGITGHPLVNGQRVNLKEHQGKPFNVLMEATTSQKTRIGQVWPYERPVQVPVQTQTYAPPPVTTEMSELENTPF